MEIEMDITTARNIVAYNAIGFLPVFATKSDLREAQAIMAAWDLAVSA